MGGLPSFPLQWTEDISVGLAPRGGRGPTVPQPAGRVGL